MNSHPKRSDDFIPKSLSSKEEEINFMANYVWPTLVALYDRLKLYEKLKLRNIDEDIVVGGVISEALRAIEILNELSDTIKSILKKLQAIITEEISVEKHAIRGRILVNLVARYYPAALPIARTKLVLDTPANLLLIVTLLEVRNTIIKVLNYLSSRNSPSELSPLKSLAIERLRKFISICDYLLTEPILKALINKARTLVGNTRRINDLEERVREDILKRPREYRAYMKLLRLRELLSQELKVIEKDSQELGEILSLKITASKLYELYGFTLILESLINILSGKEWKVHLNREGRVLIFERPEECIKISYNAIPQGVKSRLSNARYYGIINGEIKVDKLGGLPDTIIVRDWKGKRRILVIDYKYTRDVQYLVESRFKAYSYLHEFNADCAMIIAPSPKEATSTNEEVYEQRGFYLGIAPYKGAIVVIDDSRKMLILTYVDPDSNSIKMAKYTLTKVLRIALF